MRTVREILDALFARLPAEMKEEWDNVGLLCGHGDKPVERVLVALDPFPNVVQEAVKAGAQLIVTHHPLIFSPIRAVNDQSVVGRTILELVEHGIAAINMHTNLDSAPGGVNDVLAQALGLKEIQVLAPAGTDDQGRPYGLCRYGIVDSCPLPVFLDRVQERLGCGGVRYADGGKAVRCVAVGGGSCGDFIQQVLEKGCDTFVTADLKYNMFADAQFLGLNLIDAGHFPTENLVCETLAGILREAFPDLDVQLSKKHADAVKFL